MRAQLAATRAQVAQKNIAIPFVHQFFVSLGTHLSQFAMQVQTLNVPYYSTIGNHELFGDWELWSEYFGRHNVHFSFKGAAFSLVDSGSASIDPLVYQWLDSFANFLRYVDLVLPLTTCTYMFHLRSLQIWALPVYQDFGSRTALRIPL